MQFNKTLAGAVVGVVIAGSALTACTSHSTEYDRVYDTRTHTYVVVTHTYYVHHKSYYSGSTTKVSSPKSTKTSSTKKKLVCKIVKKHKSCR